ncbi:hypothetical protein GWK47_032738 [Chionoecetes opilio]|uniref:Uncharacterized protein n=1 Tax=Chionoecetes opilio TaxID=41210 RepID=A0A8J4YIJ7_CHIOP|nr:hypothetical protein GWK47_032738 [Chionoecetes opilio]
MFNFDLMLDLDCSEQHEDSCYLGQPKLFGYGTVKLNTITKLSQVIGQGFKGIYGKKISDSFQECNNYQLTSTVESLESNSDPDDEGLLLRGRRKRSKKDLPEDFVSSEDLHEKGHMMPVSQKTPVTASPEKVASAPSQVLFPKPPPEVSSNLLSIRTPGLTESGAAKRSRSSDYNKYGILALVLFVLFINLVY